MARIAAERMRGVDPNAADPHRRRLLRRVQRQARPVPVPLLAARPSTPAPGPRWRRSSAAALANIGAYGLLRFGGELLPGELALAGHRADRDRLRVASSTAACWRSRGATRARCSPTRRSARSGYVLVAIGVGGPVGFAAAILYTVVNALNKTLLFLTVELRGAIVGARVRARRAQRRRRAARGRVRRQARAVPRRDRRSAALLVAALPRQRAVVRLRVPDLPVRLLARRADRAGQPAGRSGRSSRRGRARSCSPSGCGPSRCSRSATRAAEACSRGCRG